MVRRLWFILVVVLFGAMNFLLWRTEISGRNQLGGSVPVDMVWEKMVTAPDDSALEIRFRDRKLGYCRWSPNVGAELATGKRFDSEDAPEGMVGRVTGYSLDFDGTFSFTTNVVRFNVRSTLNTNHVWQRLSVRLHRRPDLLVISADQASEEIQFTIESGDDKVEQTLTFAQARDPQKLLRQFGGPFLPSLLAGMGYPLNFLDKSSTFSFGLRWEAHYDWMKIGHSRLRVYRLHARLFDQSEIVVLVSRVGEILRIELPQKVTLINEALINF